MADVNIAPKQNYASIVQNSERVSWKLDDIMPPGTALDFERPFMPQALASTDRISCLDGREKRMLNQIAGKAYLNLFAFVEEYIITTVTRHITAELYGDHDALRALMRFGDEELKHQQLFARYGEAFDRGFGHDCETLGSAADVAVVINSKHPIAVMLLTLQLEIMTQAHYSECVKDDHGIDPLFVSLLKHHWMEEAQHEKIDRLELQKMVSGATPESIDQAFVDLLEIYGAFDGLLAGQARMDYESLARATGREYTEDEAREIVDSQHRSLQKTFLVYGMMHPVFVQVMQQLSEKGARQVTEHAANLG